MAFELEKQKSFYEMELEKKNKQISNFKKKTITPDPKIPKTKVLLF